MTKKRWFAVLYMFVITFVFTSAVSALYLVNDQRIVLNKEVRLQRIILDTMDMRPEGETPNERIREVFADRVAKLVREGKTAYFGYSEGGGDLVGIAFPLAGPGFWGPIWGMMGVEPDLSTVIDIAFYEHGETPGLGGRISEEWFSDQFEDEPLKKRDGQYFDFVSAGTSDEEGEVDAISGATETSTRVERFMNKDIENMLAWLEQVKQSGDIPEPTGEPAPVRPGVVKE
ncbi:MAG: FMN-binding protein [Desulfatibacillaceae bacterium]